MNRNFFILLALFLLGLSPLSAGAEWKPLVKGLEYRSHQNSSGDMVAHFFRINPKALQIDLLAASDFGEKALSAIDFRKKSRSLLVINGGFFDETFQGLGLFQRNGKMIRPLRKVSWWGIFTMSANKTGRISPLQNWKQIQPSSILALQAGPRLVIDGNIPTLKESSPTHRSGIGITSEGQVEIGLAEWPLTMSEWAALFREDCPNALNLDGGGSSQISVDTPSLSLNIPGLTPVANAVSVKY